MDKKDLLKRVRRIEIKTKRLSEQLFSGEYHSSFKGQGMAFDEVRRYQFGDDVRDIDWNVTARYNEPYIKVFEEERERTLMLGVDVSGSQLFGTRNQSKRELLTEISATLAFSAIQNNDKVGLLLFSSQVEHYIPPKKGRSHVLRLISALLDYRARDTRTHIGQALQFLSNVQKRRTIAFLLSDFDDPAPYERSLKIAARKHELIGVRVYDARERELPNLGMIDVVDAETGAHLCINTASKRVRRAYGAYNRALEKRFVSSFARAGAHTLQLTTEDSYVQKLLGYFSRRC